MRINDVFCDVCNEKAGYTNDWKRPDFINNAGHKVIYEFIGYEGYIDICPPCFDEIQDKLKLYLKEIVRHIRIKKGISNDNKME